MRTIFTLRNLLGRASPPQPKHCSGRNSLTKPKTYWAITSATRHLLYLCMFICGFMFQCVCMSVCLLCIVHWNWVMVYQLLWWLQFSLNWCNRTSSSNSTRSITSIHLHISAMVALLELYEYSGIIITRALGVVNLVWIWSLYDVWILAPDNFQNLLWIPF